MSAPASSAFISYSREDSEFALRLARDLKAAGASVWLDQLDIEPGFPWDKAIDNAITSASDVLLVLSPSSAGSFNVRDEISFAVQQGKAVIPILYKESVVPLQLERIQRIDFRANYTLGLNALLARLRVTQPMPSVESAAKGNSTSQAIRHAGSTPKPEVFICNSASDNRTAEAACAAIEAERNKCWMAPRDILAGEEWVEAIMRALSSCKVVVLIFSRAANDSSRVRREIDWAVENDKIIIPFRIEDVSPGHAIELALHNRHWLDALTPPLERHLKELSETISRVVKETNIVEQTDRPGHIAPVKVARETNANPSQQHQVDQLVEQHLSIPFEAYVGDKPYIFASYCHDDSLTVFPELKLLHEHGFRIWYDEGVASGSDWSDYVATTLEGAAVFLVFISRSAVASQNVRDEIFFALDHRQVLRFLPIYIENVSLTPGLRLRMKSIHGIMKWQMADDYYKRKIISSFPDSVIDPSRKIKN